MARRSSRCRIPVGRWLWWLAAVCLVAAACSGSAADRLGDAPTPATAPPTESTPPSTTTTEPPPQTSVPPVPGAGYVWQAGDCFDFGRADGLSALPYAPYGDGDMAACAGPHTHDVYHVDQVVEGPRDPFPDDLGERVEAACSGAFLDDYGLMWPDSTYSLIRYLPDEEEWAAGERYLACVAYRSAPDGLVERRDSPAGGSDVVWPATVGTCFQGDLGSFRQPETIDCGQPHTFEVVGVGTHPAGADDPFPSQSQLDGFMDEFCLDELEGYAGQSSGQAAVIPMRYGGAEWDLGYRTMRCLAFATDGSELALVRGSFSGDWTVIGPAGGDVVTA